MSQLGATPPQVEETCVAREWHSSHESIEISTVMPCRNEETSVGLARRTHVFGSVNFACGLSWVDMPFPKGTGS